MGKKWEWGFWDYKDKEQIYNDVFTEYEQVALDVIRASGGKNKDRYIMAPGYAASGDFLGTFKLLKDIVENNDKRVLISTHAYTPSNFALEGDKTSYDSSIEKDIDWLFSNLNGNFVKKGKGTEVQGTTVILCWHFQKWKKFFLKKA